MNLAFGWCWILVGLLAGVSLGPGLRRESWRGGYASRERRLLRLAHVACVALGLLNVAFGCAAPASGLGVHALPVASGCLVAGAMAMPACCLLAARSDRAQALFAVPVAVLLLGVGLTAAASVAEASRRVTAPRSPVPAAPPAVHRPLSSERSTP